MSIFASRVQKTIELPFDPPQTVTIRKLSGRQLERARIESQIASAEYTKRMGDEFRKEIAAIDFSKPEIQQQIAADPLIGVDRTTVLTKGIVAWSYTEPVSPTAVEDLSDEAAAFLAREIMVLTKNGTSAEAKKND